MPLKHSHGGHRSRLRARFRKTPDSLEDHELLELLLFYAIPQKDTNPIAHDLLQRFGSLSGVLNATLTNISQVPGMGETSSQLFPVILELNRRYLREQLSKDPPKAYTPEYVGGVCLSKFFEKTEEHVWVLVLNSRYDLVAELEIGVGDFSSAPINTVQLSGLINQYKNCFFVIAHNHPSGIALPSEADYKTTDFLRVFIADSGGRMLDHLIFDGRGDFVSLGDSNQLNGENRYYYEVHQVEDECSGDLRFVFTRTPLVADIMTKKQTLDRKP